MNGSICLNVLRHPSLPVPRWSETYDQWIDPAFWRANDDVHPERGPAEVAAAVPRLLLDPDRPLLLRHSPAVRTRKAAELFAGHLRAVYRIELLEEPALAELDFDPARVWTRAEHERPDFGPRQRTERLYRAMLTDGDPAAPGAHARITRAVAALREALAKAGPVNHLWVTHGLIMPFLRLGVVEQVPAGEWTVERARAVAGAGYAGGFHVRLSLPSLSPA
jgi:hypothetical protein